MVSIRVKFRPSVVSGREGTVFYQLIKDKITKQITTTHKIYAKEWDSEKLIIDVNGAQYHRRGYLQAIE